MTAIILSLFSKGTLYMVAAAAVAGFLAWVRNTGVKAERAKQARKELAAAQDRLEMDREATEAERQAAGMTDEEASKEALKWARR